MSDTSFTRGVDDEDFSLEDEEKEADTTDALLHSARSSVNIASKPTRKSAGKKRTVQMT